MKQIKIILLSAGLFLFISSCEKDKLTDEYQILEGSYEWKSTGSQKDVWTNGPDMTPVTTGYTCTIELNGNGEIIFYKNGAVITKEKYSFLQKEHFVGGAKIYIKLKGKTSKSWNIESKMTLTLSQDTSMTIDKFPFKAIDDAGNYHSGYTNTNNSFVKK